MSCGGTPRCLPAPATPRPHSGHSAALRTGRLPDRDLGQVREVGDPVVAACEAHDRDGFEMHRHSNGGDFE